jgi:ADP-ribose pyrophosphatase YjhB (NUDIX family)
MAVIVHSGPSVFFAFLILGVVLTLAKGGKMLAEQVFYAYSGQADETSGQFKYCPLCGTPLVLKDKAGRQRPACPNCRFVQFKNPSPGAVVLIERDGQVLLGRRSGSVGTGQWGLPMGFIEHDEDFLTAAIREVKEETGLDVEIRSLLSVVSNFLSPRLHTLAIVLLARVVGDPAPRAGDDLEAVQWFPLAGPLPEMAFEADAHICERYYHTRLQGAPVDPWLFSNQSFYRA